MASPVFRAVHGAVLGMVYDPFQSPLGGSASGMGLRIVPGLFQGSLRSSVLRAVQGPVLGMVMDPFWVPLWGLVLGAV